MHKASVHDFQHLQLLKMVCDMKKGKWDDGELYLIKKIAKHDNLNSKNY